MGEFGCVYEGFVTDLVHSSIGEEECRVLIGNCRRGGDVCVVLGSEVRKEFLAHFLCSPTCGHPVRCSEGKR